MPTANATRGQTARKIISRKCCQQSDRSTRLTLANLGPSHCSRPLEVVGKLGHHHHMPRCVCIQLRKLVRRSYLPCILHFAFRLCRQISSIFGLGNLASIGCRNPTYTHPRYQMSGTVKIGCPARPCASINQNSHHPSTPSRLHLRTDTVSLAMDRHNHIHHRVSTSFPQPGGRSLVSNRLPAITSASQGWIVPHPPLITSTARQPLHLLSRSVSPELGSGHREPVTSTTLHFPPRFACRPPCHPGFGFGRIVSPPSFALNKAQQRSSALSVSSASRFVM
ncbi:hypothetical protein B0J13DRAFT_22630 [Dactylonectria estremocensis]|uniref:Uncharacterized protein n=1 Tax=Dactylonectria estremocensis TaxID=1079267 RepID=A0A9P9FKT0_9HYPO|nr:hypothetical protein B0J13DRAFT_22630 [Dactylonectria estremocensis]